MPQVTVVVRQDKADHRPDAFTCRDCEGVFNSGMGFSGHFIRREGSIEIVGCKIPVKMRPA